MVADSKKSCNLCNRDGLERQCDGTDNIEEGRKVDARYENILVELVEVGSRLQNLWEALHGGEPIRCAWGEQ